MWVVKVEFAVENEQLDACQAAVEKLTPNTRHNNRRSTPPGFVRTNIPLPYDAPLEFGV